MNSDLGHSHDIGTVPARATSDTGRVSTAVRHGVGEKGGLR